MLDDCLVPGADAIPSSASSELPSTPCDVQNPLSEETPDGELPTVSMTFDQTTIESSSVTSSIVTPHNIEKPWESAVLDRYIWTQCGSDVFSKRVICITY